MAITPNLGDGESFVPGRSTETAKELIEAAEAAGLPGSVVVTTSHGYVVPSEILSGAGQEKGEEESVKEFDPSEATVAEVKEYLDHADATERERVLSAEADGKNRSGVLSYVPEGA